MKLMKVGILVLLFLLSLLSMKDTILMVGFSMYPTVGPLAIGLCRNETIKEGDIIAFRYMNHSITHRVISIQGNTIVTKGDHNDFYEVINKKDVKCKVVWYLSLIPPESIEKLYKKMKGE